VEEILIPGEGSGAPQPALALGGHSSASAAPLSSLRQSARRSHQPSVYALERCPMARGLCPLSRRQPLQHPGSRCGTIMHKPSCTRGNTRRRRSSTWGCHRLRFPEPRSSPARNTPHGGRPNAQAWASLQDSLTPLSIPPLRTRPRNGRQKDSPRLVNTWKVRPESAVIYSCGPGEAPVLDAVEKAAGAPLRPIAECEPGAICRGGWQALGCLWEMTVGLPTWPRRWLGP